MRKTLLLFVSILAVCILLLGCTTGSGSVLVGTEHNSGTVFSMTHKKFTGYKQRTLSVEEVPFEVSVQFTTDSGLIDAYIQNQNTGEYCYRGQEIQTSSFTVTLTEPGKYILRVDAKKHSGSYQFSWDQ